MTSRPHPWEASYPPGLDWGAALPVMPLPALLDRAVAAYPERTALSFRAMRISFAELGARVDRFARGSCGAGDRPGRGGGAAAAELSRASRRLLRRAASGRPRRASDAAGPRPCSGAEDAGQWGAAADHDEPAGRVAAGGGGVPDRGRVAADCRGGPGLGGGGAGSARAGRGADDAGPGRAGCGLARFGRRRCGVAAIHGRDDGPAAGGDADPREPHQHRRDLRRLEHGHRARVPAWRPGAVRVAAVPYLRADRRSAAHDRQRG